jgi:hypothetical protein
MKRKSKKYLNFIKGRPCIFCGRPGEPHHVRIDGNHGVGIKPPDYDTVPLCRDCHNGVHRGFSWLAIQWPVGVGEDAKTVFRFYLYREISRLKTEYIIQLEDGKR